MFKLLKSLFRPQSLVEQHLSEATTVTDLEQRMRSLGSLNNSLMFAGKC